MAEAQAVMKTTSGDGDQLRNLQERSEGAIYRPSIVIRSTIATSRQLNSEPGLGTTKNDVARC